MDEYSNSSPYARPVSSSAEFRDRERLFISAIPVASSSILSEAAASKWYERRLLTSTLGEWVRSTFLVESAQRSEAHSSSSSSSSTTTAHRVGCMESIISIEVRMKWFFRHFKTRTLLRNSSSLTQERDLVYSWTVYSLTLQYRYLLLLRETVSRARGGEARWRRVRDQNGPLEVKQLILNRSWKRLKDRFLARKRSRPRYPRQVVAVAFQTLRWQLLLSRARGQALRAAAQHARTFLGRAHLRRLLAKTRGRMLDVAF